MSNSYFVKVHLVKSVDSDAAAASCLLFLFFWELSQCVVVHVYSPLPSGNKNWTLNLTTCITFLNPTGQTFFEQVILFYFASFLFKSKLWKKLTCREYYLGYCRPNYQHPIWYSESLVYVFQYSTIILKKTLCPHPKYLLNLDR